MASVNTFETAPSLNGGYGNLELSPRSGAQYGPSPAFAPSVGAYGGGDSIPRTGVYGGSDAIPRTGETYQPLGADNENPDAYVPIPSDSHTMQSDATQFVRPGMGMNMYSKE